MNPEEAEKIVHAYGKALEEKSFAGKKSDLPCSIGRIKLAYLTYIEEIIKQGILTDEWERVLIGSYSYLPCFQEDEDADRINKAFEASKKAKEKGESIDDEKYKDVREDMGDLTKLVPPPELYSEIQTFIDECKENYN
jgi:hypothetical protein